MNPLKERIIEISKKYDLSHVGSNLSAVDILDSIYPKGEVIVSSGHAGIAYFVVKEKYDGDDAEEQFKEYGIHAQMYGSLGHGIGVALGKALANRNKDIYCLISDGECMEGSIWEALRIASELKVFNLKIFCNANGWGGMQAIDQITLNRRLASFDFPVNFVTTTNEPLKNELKAHYEKIIR